LEPFGFHSVKLRDGTAATLLTTQSQTHDPVQLLFDLDGTLTDSSLGIMRRLAHTMQVLGPPVPSSMTAAPLVRLFALLEMTRGRI
jgi:hypothetical protein